MIFNLTYIPAPTAPVQDPCTLRWVTPTGWTEQTIRNDFERRFYGTRVVSLEPTEVIA